MNSIFCKLEKKNMHVISFIWMLKLRLKKRVLNFLQITKDKKSCTHFFQKLKMISTGKHLSIFCKLHKLKKHKLTFLLETIFLWRMKLKIHEFDLLQK
eukprot:UN27745